MQGDQELIHVRVLWGSFGADRCWHPNHLLDMDADEQWRQNMLTNPGFVARFNRRPQ